VSVIADPPAKRRPVRTIVEPFNPAAVHTALLREAKRGGQSFVVAPRIGDLGPLIEELRDLVPTLTIVTAHGEVPPEAVDEAMVGFAEGRGDVLVATNIIESGLDVPRANTILVVGAERFGLAQLHQLRGRVGRGRTQGAAYLFTDPHKDPEPTTLARLTTLQAFDHLGAGLELAGQDLDVRGAGDLTGEDQAGHIKLIGAGLYQKLMQRAVRSAQGETLEASWSPQIQAEDQGLLEDAYVPDPATRLALYARLAGVETLAALDALAEEIDDRFGPPTPAAATLLALTRLRLLAKTAAMQSVRLGPKAAALVPRKAAAARIRRLTAEDLEWRDDRLIIYASGDAADETPTGGPPLLKRTAALLQMLSAARGGRRKTKRPAGEEVKARTDG
jgi:transcription-repair coupling factor (superfamily II helicase)